MGTFILPVLPVIGCLSRAYQRSSYQPQIAAYPHQCFTGNVTNGSPRSSEATRILHGELVSSLGSGFGSISYLSPLLAIIVGIVHASLAPVIVIGDAKPNIALIAVVLVTCLGGFMPGITWAFVTGLTVNLLVGAPLGSVPLALLVVAALVAGGQRLVGRTVWVYPIAATFLGSIVADLVGLGIGQLVSDAPIGAIPTDLILSAAVLNTVIAAIVLIPARAIAARTVPDEAAAW
jgi:cell shape-determining protein MreD